MARGCGAWSSHACSVTVSTLGSPRETEVLLLCACHTLNQAVDTPDTKGEDAVMVARMNGHHIKLEGEDAMMVAS